MLTCVSSAPLWTVPTWLSEYLHANWCYWLHLSVKRFHKLKYWRGAGSCGSGAGSLIQILLSTLGSIISRNCPVRLGTLGSALRPPAPHTAPPPTVLPAQPILSDWKLSPFLALSPPQTELLDLLPSTSIWSPFYDNFTIQDVNSINLSWNLDFWIQLLLAIRRHDEKGSTHCLQKKSCLVVINHPEGKTARLWQFVL